MRRNWLFAGMVVLLAPSVRADEGMWPFDMVPKDKFKKDHGVDVTDAWLDKVRLATVRLSSGGTGSFVSPRGLILTNHHVAADCIQKVGKSGSDYMETGFLAGKDGEELKCPDLEVNVLLATVDVTDRVRAAKKAGMSDAEANVAMKSEMSKIEQECTDKAMKVEPSRCDVIPLYAGQKYHLYTYRRYTDVRLVFAPEFRIAFFGGDPDNFTYPRFDLDMALFRVYEGNKPLAPKSRLKWNDAGPKDGDVVFTSGNPASTARLATKAQLERQKATTLPYAIGSLSRQRVLLNEFMAQSQENTREAHEEIFGVENSLKALTGFKKGLDDAALMKTKADDEAALVKAVNADPKLKAAYGTVLADIAKAQDKLGAVYARYAVLERGGGTLLEAARDLVRLSVERDLPNDKRLREYRESNMESLRLSLLSPAAVFGGVEAIVIREWMERAVRDLKTDPLAAKITGGDTPQRAAQTLAATSSLYDVYARKKLLDGGKSAIADSKDPAIVLMRTIDADARAIRKQYEDEVEAPMRQLGQKVAEMNFAARGTSAAPDATFTLRLSIGVVKGYTENGKKIAATMDFAGMYAHATGKDPYKLPDRWIARKDKLTPTTSLNFVSTNDIMGGNSGSPVVNATGDIVGLIFDSNLSALPNRFVYRDETQRAVSVSTAGMTEALLKIYEADALVKELHE